MDGLKIAAFPMLVAIVAYFSKSTVDEVKAMAVTQGKVMETVMRIEIRMDMTDERLERLEQIVYGEQVENAKSRRTPRGEH